MQYFGVFFITFAPKGDFYGDVLIKTVKKKSRHSNNCTCSGLTLWGNLISSHPLRVRDQLAFSEIAEVSVTWLPLNPAIIQPKTLAESVPLQKERKSTYVQEYSSS